MVRIPDWRNIENGWEIPTESYSDQPYIVKTDDGAWLCAVTTGAGREGQPSEHVVSMRSTDGGRTWSDLVDVEPPTIPEAAYSVMAKVPAGYPNAGRVYIFYNHNTDNIREVVADKEYFPSGLFSRVDSLGHFVFKFSDDHGKNWSEKRYDIPMRTMEIDRKNPYGGQLKFFWNVGKPIIHDDRVLVSVHKVGRYGAGGFATSEGVLVASANALTEPDPEKIVWETLPDGEIGLRTPPGGGPVAEEQSYVVLSDGSICAVYRSIDGYPVEAYSRDGGHTWTEPRYRCYADGRVMKHCRAANFHWKLENGKYIYWFHNHGGRFIGEHPKRPSMSYLDRNPVWLSAGVEMDSPDGKVIQWSQPQIGLYDDDPHVGMSYPDLVEEDGQVYLSETQKDIARLHLVNRSQLEAMWAEFEIAKITREGLFLEVPSAETPMPATVPWPHMSPFLEHDRSRSDWRTNDLRGGFSVDLWFRLDSLEPGQVLLDNRTPNRQGFCLQTTDLGTVEIVLNDGHTENRWDCDPGMLEAGNTHHLVAIVDGGPKIITFVVDGHVCDGGDFRQRGWGRYSPNLRSINPSDIGGQDLTGINDTVGGQHAASSLRIAPSVKGDILSVRIYDRYLLAAEAVGNYRAGI